MSVSVVIPTHNRASTLGRAVVSAASQSPLEVLVIDDASTDDTQGIVEQLQDIYPCVKYQRRDTKACDWQQSASESYAWLRGSHVICMGADDKLEHGVIDSVGRHEDAAVVFHDYWVCDTSGHVTGAVTNGYEAVTEFTPRQMRARLREHPHATETGIGSAIRRDRLLWLNSHAWWRMGPWSDAVGYAAVAALGGCVFVPGAGATFTDDSGGYGHQHRSGHRASEYHQAVRKFLHDAGVPFSVAAAICLKRGVPYG